MTTQQYVYMQTEPNLYTVGYYTPNNEWVSESDWDTTQEAAKRVNYLNGSGNHSEVILTPETTTLVEEVAALEKGLNTAQNMLYAGLYRGALSRKELRGAMKIALSVIESAIKERKNILNGNVPF